MKLLLVLAILYGVKSEPQQTYTYLYDNGKNLTLDSVKESAFEQTTSNNKGVKNGIYWFRIDQKRFERSILELRNSHANQLELYDSSGYRIPQISDTRFPSFFLINRSLTYPLYLKANFPLEAHFPIYNSSETEYAFQDRISFLGMGFFYGIAIALLIATLIFFFIVRKSEFLFFSVLVFTIMLTISGKDNIWNFLDISVLDSIKIESFGRLGIGLSACIFMLFYLKLRSYQSWIKYTVISMSIVGAISWLLLLLTNSVYLYSVVDATTLITIILLWLLITQIIKGKKLMLFKVIYPINVLILTNIFLLHTYNLTILDVNLVFICITAIFNFSLIGALLLITFYDIQKLVLIRKSEIETYIKQIKELDAYRKIQDTDDAYMSSLIDCFKLKNIEINVLREISKGRSNNFIKELFSLTDSRLEAITNSIYSKLGIDNSQDIKGFAPIKTQ